MIRKRFRLGRAIIAAMVFHLSLSAVHAEDTPPSRVARLNHLDGTVSFSPSGTDDWLVATPNRPLTIGDRIWSDKGARSEMHIGSTAMRLGAATSIELRDLGDDNSQLKVTQGTLSIRVRDLDGDDDIEIDTPNLAFVIREPGEYRFDVDAGRDTTIVTVRRGTGRAYGGGADNRFVEMKSNRQLTFSGDDLFYSASGDAPSRDAFDRWAAERDEREDKSRSVRYVSRDVTGYEELDDNGDWHEEPDYGPVWVPRVSVSNWAPYHYGHWTWIAPWGWTWVDDERWGFAPFHYGRWAHIRDRWAWVPGPVTRRPVYAPALVGFVGGRGSDVQWGVSLNIGTPGVAWFALAPGERYRPAYTSNSTYITNINRTVIVNRAAARNVYVNQRVPNAIAAMRASDFVRGQSAHEHRREVSQDRLKEFSRMPVASSLAIAPVRQSLAGAAPASRAAPPARAQEHNVVARRHAPEAPAYDDDLARRFAAQGTVPGAGPVFTPTARSGRDRDNKPVQRNDDDRNVGRGERVRPEPGLEHDAGRRVRAGDRPDENSRSQPERRQDQDRRDIRSGTPPTPSRWHERDVQNNTRPEREIPASPRNDPAVANPNAPARDTTPDVARRPQESGSRDAISIDQRQGGERHRRVDQDDSPRPSAPEVPESPAEWRRNDIRIARERRQNNPPAPPQQQQQQPQPQRQERQPEIHRDRQQERPSVPERRVDIREARPAEERRVDPLPSIRNEADRGERSGLRMVERQQERSADRPQQGAPREERPPRPEQQEKHEHRRERP